MLDEVHFLANRALPDDVIARLEHLKPQLGKHGGDKVGVGISEQGHRRDQLSTVKVDYFLFG